MISSLDIRSASLVDFLPDSIAQDPEIVALSKALDPELQAVATAIMEAILLPRVDQASEDVLDAMAWGFGLLRVGGWDTATLSRKRTLMAQVVALYRRRGTRWAVERALDLLGEVYTLTAWHETPPDPPFSYRVQFIVGPGGLTAEQVAQARELLDAYTSVRDYEQELSALLEAEPAETITVEAVSVGVDLTVLHA